VSRTAISHEGVLDRVDWLASMISELLAAGGGTDGQAGEGWINLPLPRSVAREVP
jgi:hypothetical protein